MSENDLDTMKALIERTREVQVITGWNRIIDRKAMSFFPEERKGIESNFFSEISDDVFPFFWRCKALNHFRYYSEYFQYLMQNSMVIESSSAWKLFRDVYNNPQQYPTSFQKLSWIPLLFCEFKLSEALYDSPLTFKNQIIHPSKPSIQQLDLNFIGIHCNESNLIECPQIVQAICSPQLVQRQQMLETIPNMSIEFTDGVYGLSYLCNNDEIIVFSSMYRAIMLPREKRMYMDGGFELRTRFDNLEGMCKMYGYIFGMIQRLVYKEYRKECPVWKKAENYMKMKFAKQREADRLKKQQMDENQLKVPRIEKRHIMRRDQTKQPLKDITNLTTLLDSLEISKVRNR